MKRKKKQVIRLRISNEETINGGASIIQPLYGGLRFMCRAPCDLRLTEAGLEGLNRKGLPCVDYGDDPYFMIYDNPDPKKRKVDLKFCMGDSDGLDVDIAAGTFLTVRLPDKLVEDLFWFEVWFFAEIKN